MHSADIHTATLVSKNSGEEALGIQTAQRVRIGVADTRGQDLQGISPISEVS